MRYEGKGVTAPVDHVLLNINTICRAVLGRVLLSFRPVTHVQVRG